MWLQRRFGVGGPVIFFRVSLCDNNLTAMFNNNFAMMQHHKYSLTDIENMIPWERDIYTALLVQWVAEENDRIKKQNQG
jgi:hypothetical protein